MLSFRARKVQWLCLLVLAMPAAGSAAVAEVNATSVLQRAERALDLKEIERLQRSYGYYIDSSDWDNVVDLLTDDESVRFVPKREAAALATAIAALIDDADARARLGRGAARAAASLPPNGHAEFMADLIVNVATLGR